MRNLSAGLYEQVINFHLEEKLLQLGIRNEQITKDNLKNFDSPVLLSQYLSPILRKSLEFLEDSPNGSNVPEQIACCNEIIKLLATRTEEDCLKYCKINEEGEVLLAIEDLKETPMIHLVLKDPLPLSLKVVYLPVLQLNQVSFRNSKRRSFQRIESIFSFHSLNGAESGSL